MTAMDLIREMFRYNDWANDTVLNAAAAIDDAGLDRRIEMGPGSLRRTLQHIYHFEAMYMSRWRGEGRTSWPDYEDRLPIAELHTRQRTLAEQRVAYLASLTPGDLEAAITWQDSRGGLYTATRDHALVQVCNHSTHHRAQAVNMIRSAGGTPLEVDYMMWIRRPA